MDPVTQIETGGYRLSICSAGQIRAQAGPIEQLAGESLDANIFYNPRFLLPAIDHLAGEKIFIALLENRKAQLRMMLPFLVVRMTLRRRSVLQAWTSPFGPLGIPLIHRQGSREITKAFLHAMARSGFASSQLVVLPELMLDCPTVKLIHETAEGLRLPWHVCTQWQRAVLESRSGDETPMRGPLSAHHARDYGRKKRRLSETGNLRHDIVSERMAALSALERFLALENSGWKGRAGTSMAADAAQTAFVRRAISRLAEAGQCAFHELWLDSNLLASIIILRQNSVAYAWKTSFDERFAKYSPGTLLMLEITRLHHADHDLSLTDSCAIPDHPVMNRIWPDQRSFGKVILGLSPKAEGAVRELDRHFQRSERIQMIIDKIRTILRGSSI